jgi:hypothetical protein
VRSLLVLSTEDDMADETSVVDARPSTKRVGVRTRLEVHGAGVSFVGR